MADMQSFVPTTLSMERIDSFQHRLTALREYVIRLPCIPYGSHTTLADSTPQST